MAFTTARFYSSHLRCADMASAKSKSMGLDSSWLFLNPFFRNNWVPVSQLQLSFTSLLKIPPPPTSFSGPQDKSYMPQDGSHACVKPDAACPQAGLGHCPLRYCPSQNHDTSGPRPQGICLCRLTVGTQCMFFEENKSWHKWRKKNNKIKTKPTDILPIN